MTSRRTFLGGTFAAAGLGWLGLARKFRPSPAAPTLVEFFARTDKQVADPGRILGHRPGTLGTAERVDLNSVKLGHFHDLMYEGDGRVAYLYEAVIPGDRARHGLVKLGMEMATA